ncbi:MAG: IS1634 family transposase [Blastocatellia bacterium]
MIDNSTPQFRAVRLDDLPPLFGLLERIKVASIFDQLIPQHPSWVGDLSFGQVVVGWQVYILSQSDHRLNHVQGWVEQRQDVYSACLNSDVRPLDFSDDRLADLLDKLSEAETWSKFESQLNQQIIRVYDLTPERVRLDPSTISTYAPVNEKGRLQLGHSKDGRPGDAQLKFQLGILDPLGLPLVTQVVAGNSADDPLYAPAILQVQASIGAGGKTYVGDVKMAALATRAQLVASGDYYLCPLSQKQVSREQREALIARAASGQAKLRPIKRERVDPLGIKPTVIEQIAEGYEISVPMVAAHDKRVVRWKERRLVIRSHAYARAQAERLEERLSRASSELGDLVVRKQGKPRLNKKQIEQAATEIIARHEVEGLLAATITMKTSRRKVRGYKDRPERTQVERSPIITLERHQAAIKEVKEQMGWRVYATNHRDLSLSEAVLAYREQYRIEDGISRLKGRPLGLSPMFLQTESRMIGLINLLTIALRVLTLLEFQVRRGLKAEGQTLKGVYAGQKGRQTARPSAELLLEAFRGIDAVVGTVKGELISYLRPLTETQKRILSLLGLDDQVYNKLLSYFQNLAPE